MLKRKTIHTIWLLFDKNPSYEPAVQRYPNPLFNKSLNEVFSFFAVMIEDDRYTYEWFMEESQLEFGISPAQFESVISTWRTATSEDAQKIEIHDKTKVNWISVKNRLPESNENVFVFDSKDKEVKSAKYITQTYTYGSRTLNRTVFMHFDITYGWEELTHVTHWIPSIEPPEGE